MFYLTDNGAQVGDMYMSLIYTCQLCGANPFDYLQFKSSWSVVPAELAVGRRSRGGAALGVSREPMDGSGLMGLALAGPRNHLPFSSSQASSSRGFTPN